MTDFAVPSAWIAADDVVALAPGTRIKGGAANPDGIDGLVRSVRRCRAATVPTLASLGASAGIFTASTSYVVVAEWVAHYPPGCTGGVTWHAIAQHATDALTARVTVASSLGTLSGTATTIGTSAEEIGGTLSGAAPLTTADDELLITVEILVGAGTGYLYGVQVYATETLT